MTPSAGGGTGCTWAPRPPQMVHRARRASMTSGAPGPLASRPGIDDEGITAAPAAFHDVRGKFVRAKRGEGRLALQRRRFLCHGKSQQQGFRYLGGEGHVQLVEAGMKQAIHAYAPLRHVRLGRGVTGTPPGGARRRRAASAVAESVGRFARRPLFVSEAARARPPGASARRLRPRNTGRRGQLRPAKARSLARPQPAR